MKGHLPKMWSDHDIARLRALVEEGKRNHELAVIFNRTQDSIASRIQKERDKGWEPQRLSRGPKWSDAERETLATLWGEGKRLSQISATMGRPLSGIRMVAAALGLRRYRRRSERIEVPAWVPANLREGFIETALDEGEHAAAAWARAEKRKDDAEAKARRSPIPAAYQGFGA
jgi:hypothetical protein